MDQLQKHQIIGGVSALVATSALLYSYYLGLFTKPKVQEVTYRPKKHIFYVNFKCSIKDLKVRATHFIYSIYVNDGLSDPSSNYKKIRKEGEFLGVYFDPPEKLLNPSDFRTSFGWATDEDLTEEEVQAILDGDKNLKHLTNL